MSINNKLAELVANEQAREILNEHLPALMNSPWLSQVMGFTLEHARTALPSGYEFSEDLLQIIQSDLSKIGTED